ncbi:MAG: hypothetical protein OXE99_15480 [Cellvibrionales bacterium]|nr:hypothetical protein [Cellvibrionales bacterium]
MATMQLTQLPTHPEPYKQAIFLSLIARCFVALVMLFFITLTQWLEWGGMMHHLHWEKLFSFYVGLLILSIISMLFKKTTAWHLLIIFAVDACLWFFVLRETGGAMNPANSYYLILLCLSSLVLPLGFTSFIFLLVIGLYTLLMLTDPHSLHSTMGWHLWGMWVSFFIIALLLSGSIYYLSSRLRKQDEAIAAFKAQTTRDEQLILMGTIAANTAHELGTPLATIAMLTEALDRDNADIIQTQIDRCKQSLEQLKKLPAQSGNLTLSSQDFLAQLENDLLLIKPDCQLAFQDEFNQSITFQLSLKQALMALAVNAIDACQSVVNIHLYTKANELIFDITHDGTPPKHTLGTIGNSTKDHGLGIGYFLANASIEQLGGTVEWIDLPNQVITQIAIPLA